MQLKDKQIRFCEEYLIDLNGTQAAIRAGYSPRTANEQAAQLLAKLSIQEYLQIRQKELQEKTGITQERVLKEYARIAFFDIRNIYGAGNALSDISDLSDDAAGAIASVKVMEEKGGNGKGEQVVIGWTKEVKLHNKVSALDSLAKHLGMFEKDNAQKKADIDFTNAKIRFR